MRTKRHFLEVYLVLAAGLFVLFQAWRDILLGLNGNRIYKCWWHNALVKYIRLPSLQQKWVINGCNGMIVCCMHLRGLIPVQCCLLQLLIHVDAMLLHLPAARTITLRSPICPDSEVQVVGPRQTCTKCNFPFQRFLKKYLFQMK